MSAGRVETVVAEVREVGPGEVRVAVHRCGICGSDLHWFAGRQPVPQVCPGHEISGVVDAVGAQVVGWSRGDRVAVEPLDRCGTCERCIRGDYHLCSKAQLFGVTLPGGMATSLVVPAHCLFRLPAAVDFELGALTEPLAVAVHALRLAGVGDGSTVLVLGAGTVGQLACVAAHRLGAAFVAATARHPQQKEAARRLGCDQVLDPTRVADVARRPQVVIETVGGTADTLDDAVSAVIRGGTVVIVGLFDRSPSFNPLAMLIKEVRIVGSMVYNRRAGEADFDVALSILADRGEELRSLVTDVFSLDDAQTAFERAALKSSGSVKVMLAPNA